MGVVSGQAFGITNGSCQRRGEGNAPDLQIQFTRSIKKAKPISGMGTKKEVNLLILH